MIADEFFLLLRMLSEFNTNSFQYIKEWEEIFAHYLGVRYAIAVNSGRTGMKFILRSLELNRGDEVIIPAYTLVDLVGIIQSLGLTVVPADIDSKTFNINPDSIIKKITARTKVILATHIFGMPCQIDRILDIARPRSIFVIEDCAHSIGAEFKGRKTGSFGDASFFSFETIKPINTYGGGMVTTNDERLAQNVRKAVVHYEGQAKAPVKKIISAFIENWLLPTPLSFPVLYLLTSPYWNKKMYNFYRQIQKLSALKSAFTDLQAFLGIEKLKTLDERIAHRRRLANLFKSLLNSKFVPQQLEEGILSNYYFFVALVPSDTKRLRRLLLTHGIDAGIGAEIADDCGSLLGHSDCSIAKEVFQRAIQLPLHEGMLEHHILYVAKVLKRQFK